MSRPGRYPAEMRERAVRLVQETRGGVPVAVGGHYVDRHEVWDDAGDAAEVGATR